LYSFDAQAGQKVVAPIDTNQWITLSALNRLRRNDPTKIEPLWHSKYNILSTWFSSTSAFSMYTHLSAGGALLSCLLDAPLLLATTVVVLLSVAFLLTLPVWETILRLTLTSPLVWMQWHQWARFVHAAFPLKLLLGQLAFKGVASLFGRLLNDVRGRLVELECQILEKCVPLTILEDIDESISEATVNGEPLAYEEKEEAMEELNSDDAVDLEDNFDDDDDDDE
jgi:hypothetical protein